MWSCKVWCYSQKTFHIVRKGPMVFPMSSFVQTCTAMNINQGSFSKKDEKLKDYERRLKILSFTEGLSKCTNASNLALNFSNLTSVMYRSISHIPFLYSTDYQTAYVQLTLQGTLDTYFSFIHSSPGFCGMLQSLEINIAVLGLADIAEILCSLVWIGVPPYDHNCQKLVSMIISKIGTVQIDNGLEPCCRLLRLITPYNYVLVKAVSNCILQSQMYLASTVFHEQHSKALTIVFVSSLHQAGKFLGMDLIENSLITINNSLNQYKPTLNLSDLKILGQFVGSVLRRRPLSEKILSEVDKLSHRISEDLIYCAHSFRGVDFLPFQRWLTMNLRYVNRSTLLHLLHREAVDILKSSSQIKDIASTLSVFNRTNSSPEICRLIDSSLLRCLLDADVTTLSTVALALLRLKHLNKDVLNVYWMALIKQLDAVFEAGSRLFTILRFLSTTPLNMHKGYHEIFVDRVCDELLNDRTISIRRRVVMVEYMLPRLEDCMSTQLYDKVYHTLQRSLGSVQYPLAVLAASRMDTMPDRLKVKPSLQSQLSQLQSLVLQSDISKHCTSVEQMVDLLRFQAINRIEHHIRSRTSFAQQDHIKRLIDGLIPKINLLSPRKYQQLCSTLFVAQINHSTLLEEMAKFILHHSPSLDFSSKNSFLRLLGHIGYGEIVSNKFPNVLENIVDHFMDISGEMGVIEKLSTLLRFSQLEVFPEESLLQMFSLDTMLKLDDLVEDFPEKRRYVGTVLMMLNRAVVLEYPQMDLPWFHDHCPVEYSRHTDVRSSVLNSEIEPFLISVLGDRKFLRRNSAVPYCYSLDFECAVNKHGQAVPMQLLNRAQLPPGDVTKVAIMPLCERRMCQWDPKPIGVVQCKSRHLQLLGYRVVQIPISEWNSISMCSDTDRQSYLKQKIFAA